MQEIGIAFNGKETNIPNHLNKDYHEVNVKNDSLLFNIIKTNKILVNSRHKSAIYNTSLDICGFSHDNVIEAIEDKSKKFFLGLEWHPENMYIYDLNSRKIFDYFVNICNDK